jgi:hypothetical protein
MRLRIHHKETVDELYSSSTSTVASRENRYLIPTSLLLDTSTLSHIYINHSADDRALILRCSKLDSIVLALDSTYLIPVSFLLDDT